MTNHSISLGEIGSMLIDSELFKHLPGVEMRSAAKFFSVNKITRDEIVFNEGDAGTFMCIVHSGCVAVIKTNQHEEPVEMFSVSDGRAFGEMAVLDSERRSATCQAKEDSVLLTLSKDALNQMLEEHPRIAARIIRAIAISLSRRLRMAVGKLVDHVV